ncbi:hypothetical protein AVDCRST_MAG94-7142 [uncultured Leptolyngbya sp.]|uniref:Uncharacterized protein n=1 Tax=uncultured Leptolyngbya sp. TaxID=332963 RepID=A0A6J4PVU0_9CYAN|nr:hypothetical protein AVDCRST_MAG94-7142 [uncultured Leptolyngbya sp.]
MQLANAITRRLSACFDTKRGKALLVRQCFLLFRLTAGLGS